MNKLKTSAAFTFAIKLSSMILALLLNLFLARVLDIESFGIFVYAIATTRLLSIAGNVGLNKLLIREIAIYESREQWNLIQSLMRWSDVIVGIASTALTIAAILISGLIFSGERSATFEGLSLCLISLPIISLASLRSSTLKGFRSVLPALIPEFIVSPIITIIVPVVLYFYNSTQLTTRNIILGYVISTLISLILSEILVKSKLKKYRSKFTLHPPSTASLKSSRRAWLNSAFPLMMVNAAQIIFARIDTLLLGSLSGAALAGIYAVLAYGVQIVSFIRFAVNTVLEPDIARQFGVAGISDELQEIIKKAARLIFGASLLCAIAIVATSSIWLSWFGDAFVEHRTALILLTAGELINAAAAPAWKLLVVTGNEKFIATSVTFCAVMNTVLNCLLIPHYGINGAAFATVVSIITNNILMVTWANKRVGIRTTIFT